MAEGHRGHIHLCGFILICIINLMAVIWQTIELITNDIYSKCHSGAHAKTYHDLVFIAIKLVLGSVRTH